MKVVFFIVAGLLAVSCLSAQEQVLLQDERLPGTDTIWVFTPDGYDPDQQYPVVYMLHGYSSNYKQWDQIMDAQAHADAYGMIIVCPDGFYNSWYIDSPLKENSQYATFFFEVLMNDIENRYAIDTSNRFITGLSMGGHGAFHLFLKNPSAFRSAGSTSAVVDLRGSAGLFELHEHLGDFQQNKELWLEMSSIGNTTKIAAAGKELIFDCGTADPFFQSNLELYQMMVSQKIPVTFISQPGAHDWAYWEKSIKAHFEFFKRQIE